MRKAFYCGRRGFTLVEVMVVLAIVALLAALAIPGLARMGAFSRDEFRRTVQEVSAVLRAAQIYSTTYHVETAVVYTMDHWSHAEADAVDTTPVPPVGTPDEDDAMDPAVAIADPVLDSITGNAVRQFEAVAIMYKLPNSMGALGGHYVPIPDTMGEFRVFPQDMTILLMDPEEGTVADPAIPEDLYFNVVRSNYHSEGALAYNLQSDVGMSRITAALDIPVSLDPVTFLDYANGTTPFLAENFAAHVFKPSGRLSTPVGRQRFTIYIGPRADRPAKERLVDPLLAALIDTKGTAAVTDDTSNMLYRKIHVFKSTGRTEIPKNF